MPGDRIIAKQSPPTAIDQCQKDKTSGSAQAKVHQQRLINVKKDKTSGSAQAKVHQQRLINGKKDNASGSVQIKVHQLCLAIVSSQSTSQSPPTAAGQCQKDKTSESAHAKVHQLRLINVKKTILVEAHKSKSTNSV